MDDDQIRMDLKDEPLTGAIRMMAFGVLEHEPREIVTVHRVVTSSSAEGFEAMMGREQRSLEIEAMVVTEFIGLGWKLAHTKSGRNKDQFILLGAMGGSEAMPVRPKIAEGSLQDVCRAAVDWLDNGPHTARAAVDWLDNGPQPGGRRMTTVYHER